MRLFVALALEPAIHEALAALQRQLTALDPAGSVRWVPRDGIHLTLRFLGESREGALPRLSAALERTLPPLRAPLLAPSALGGFPSLARPRVLWVGIRDADHALADLAAAVDAAVVELGWPRDGKAFQPHLTLGRVREPGRPLPRRLAAALHHTPGFALEPRPHRRVALMQSHLGPTGARYEKLGQWRLQPW